MIFFSLSIINKVFVSTYPNLTSLIILSLFFSDEKDFGQNAEVEYILSGGNGTSLFHLDRYSGRCNSSQNS